MSSIVKKWLCESCRFTLGFVENDAIVRIKRKDLYVTVEGGNVTEVCPRCGKVNTLKSVTDPEQSTTTPQTSG